MKAELTLPQELVDLIADKVIEKLKPLLSGNGRHEDDTLMTIDEAASFLKIKGKDPKAQIYQWVHNSQHGFGNFPYLKRGRRLLFSTKALMKWLETR